MFHSLACHLTTSLDYSSIFLPRGQPIHHHICVHMSFCSRVWVCVCVHHNVCGCMCVCGFHVCLWTASLYIYWNEQPSPGHLCRAQACSHASIYRLPRIRAWLKQPLPCGPREVTHTETKFRRGELGEVSWGQIRGPVFPSRDMKAWNDTVCLCTCHQKDLGLFRQNSY